MNKNINISITADKIKMIKKIGPYFPEDLHPLLNKSITITEKIIKAYEVLDFMQNQEVSHIEKVIPVKNNRERLSYISSTLGKELQEQNIKDIGRTMETVLNADRLNKIFTALLPMLSDPKALESPDKIFKLMDVFMEGKSQEEKKKMGEMIKMLELVKNLDASKENTSQKQLPSK